MAESKLAKFVEDIIVPPRMVDIIVEGEVYLILLIVEFLLVIAISSFFTFFRSCIIKMCHYNLDKNVFSQSRLFHFLSET